MRLDRFLSSQTAFSRRELTARIRSGAVTLNGEICRKPDISVNPETDSVTLGGAPVVYAKQHYFLMHKPTGVLTATRDASQKTVLDLLKPEDRLNGLAPAGRLDRDTSGLLLITDDGQLTHQILSPKSHAAKYYLAMLRDAFQDDYIPAFQSGILLREGDAEEPCLPAECAQLGERLALLAIKEGKYHQVRRMFAAVGNQVTALLRVQSGMLALPPDLPAGAYSPILPKEAQSMLKNPAFSDVCSFASAHYSSYWIKERI